MHEIQFGEKVSQTSSRECSADRHSFGSSQLRIFNTKATASEFA